MDEFWTDVRFLSCQVGVDPDAFRKWQERTVIPPKWHYALLMAAENAHVELSWKDLMDPPPFQKGQAQ